MNPLIKERGHALSPSQNLIDEITLLHLSMIICVMQVLFSEQVKMRTAMQEKEPALQCDNSEQDGTQPSTSIEIKNLREELENVKTRMAALQKDYSELQREYEKLSNKHKIVSSWSLGWRKIKNSFHSKADADETGNRRQTFNSTGRQTSFRRRPSLP